jgi:DNA repair exonuclease SbcCD ATPase subunit
MRILKASVTNFASYKSLEIELTDKGLMLVSGPTGSGKSTMCDIVPWILFGKTAKNGSVDEIRSWFTSEPTTGMLHIDNNGVRFTVFRIRGSGKNDLWFSHIDSDGTQGEGIRGKDLNDTQAILNELLGTDIDKYLAGAYFHEFSQTTQFFTTNAKNRRQITEQMADLTLTKALSEALSEDKKITKKDKEAETQKVIMAEMMVATSTKALNSEQLKFKSWKQQQDARLQQLKTENKTFEADKVEAIKRIKEDTNNSIIEMRYDIEQLKAKLIPDADFNKQSDILTIKENACGDTKCKECGALKDSSKRMAILKDKYALENKIKDNDRLKINITTLEQRIEMADVAAASEIRAEEAKKNTAAELIAELKSQKNPYDAKPIQKELQQHQAQLVARKTSVVGLAIRMADLDLLSQTNDAFRMLSIKNLILDLETNTNGLLRKYFDAELTVAFKAEDADKLDVTIAKDGNLAAYTQLSKGQRGLLKLCFGVSVMKAVGNHHGAPSALFFDEALDGLSESLKLQAFKLFESLQNDYESIFIVDHSTELKSCFDRRFEVTLENGESQLAEA